MAKFKVGDKVEYIGPIAGFKGMKGVVETAEGVRLVIKMDDGSKHVATEDKFKAINSRVCNGEWKIKSVIDAMDDAKAYLKSGHVNPNMSNVLRTAISVYERTADATDKRNDMNILAEAKRVLARLDAWKPINSRACNSSNPVVRNAMNGCAATNAKLENGAFLKEFVSYAKGALGDIQRQCNESLASIKAKGKEMQSRSEKDGFSVEWSAIVNKGVVFVGVVKEILRDIDHAISQY